MNGSAFGNSSTTRDAASRSARRSVSHVAASRPKLDTVVPNSSRFQRAMILRDALHDTSSSFATNAASSRSSSTSPFGGE